MGRQVILIDADDLVVHVQNRHQIDDHGSEVETVVQVSGLMPIPTMIDHRHK